MSGLDCRPQPLAVCTSIGKKLGKAGEQGYTLLMITDYEYKLSCMHVSLSVLGIHIAAGNTCVVTIKEWQWVRVSD